MTRVGTKRLRVFDPYSATESVLICDISEIFLVQGRAHRLHRFSLMF